MVKFLANENVPGAAVLAVREAGFDLTWIKDCAAGADDETVMSMALAEARVLVTFDKDFGEMVYRRGQDASCGVVLLRPRLRSPAQLSEFLVAVLEQAIDWKGQFSVAQEGRLRVVPLPAS